MKNEERRSARHDTPAQRTAYVMETARLALGSAGAHIARIAKTKVGAFCGTAALVVWAVLVPNRETVVRASQVEPREAPMSWYVSWADDADAIERAERTGCSDAERADSGIMFFGVGRQKDGGSTGFGKTLLPTERIVEVTAAYAKALQRCSSGKWMLALMTSNDHLDDRAEAARFGTEWARTVKATQEAAGTDRVSIRAGIDAEPGFGPMPPMQAWTEAVVAEGAHIVFGPSADGCPTDRDGPCGNGWNTAAMARMFWGTDPEAVVIPQIYKRKMGEQWVNLERVARGLGLDAEVHAILTQNKACRVTRQRPCLDLGPLRGRELASELFGRELLLGTDISW
jgi:hypothetical protein